MAQRQLASKTGATLSRSRVSHPQLCPIEEYRQCGAIPAVVGWTVQRFVAEPEDARRHVIFADDVLTDDTSASSGQTESFGRGRSGRVAFHEAIRVVVPSVPRDVVNPRSEATVPMIEPDTAVLSVAGTKSLNSISEKGLGDLCNGPVVNPLWMSNLRLPPRAAPRADP
jgi:hypothetical protein